jgi:ferrochelatase
MKAGRIGVLLLNLGTPEATDYWSMRRYLKEFLSDRRVIETPRLLWWPILNLIILTTRPGRKGKDYETIWNKERNEGPLKTITRAQAEDLTRYLGRIAGDRVVVDWAMRYGKPEIRLRIQALLDQGCDRILLVPLYPQYAAATSATVCDHAFRALMDMRWQPTVRVSPPYHDDPVYIDSVVSSMSPKSSSSRSMACRRNTS